MTAPITPDPIVSSFFRRHGAVPANDRGPQYGLASDEAIAASAESLCKAWDAYEAARPKLVAEMTRLRRESWVRCGKHELGTEGRRLMAHAWYQLVERIGFGGDRA